MDMLEQTDYRHFEREECFYYLTNFPQRQESGFCSEVNILVHSEVTTKSVSMKLRRKTALRGREQRREHEKVFENISVVLSDTDSSQSDSDEEISKYASMKLRRKVALRGREHEKVSENTDSRQSDSDEEISKSASMKLRRKIALRGREHEKVSENISVVLSDSSQSDRVKEISKSASMKLRPELHLRDREHEKVFENISVVLSDTNSSQSDSDEDINQSVIHDMKCPKKKSLRLSKEDERPLSIVEPHCGRVQKISLAPGAMAEDTLGNIRLMANTSDSELKLRSPGSRGGSELDESSTDLTLESGPSSPCHPVDAVRCKECQRLFAKMRRQPTPKKKSRDRNPASLSCDQWILLKRWHPQRPNREKGLLWKSLSRIRMLSAQASDSSAIIRTPATCSRPHVFQRRILHRCKSLISIRTDLSITRAKPRSRKRPRAAGWPPVGGWKYSVKRKSSVNDTLSQQLYPLNLSVSVTQEEKRLVDDQISRLNADRKQNSDAASKQRTQIRGKQSKQEKSDGIEGTRRVLKFDETTAEETVEQRKSPRPQHESGETREARNGFQYEQQEELSENSDGFRTPTDLFSIKQKIKRGNQKKASASGDTMPSVQKPNFKSMLIATLVKNQNQIIKESCK